MPRYFYFYVFYTAKVFTRNEIIKVAVNKDGDNFNKDRKSSSSKYFVNSLLIIFKNFFLVFFRSVMIFLYILKTCSTRTLSKSKYVSKSTPTY